MESNKLDKIISLCKRRGFIYQSSEIYGGFSAVYDYGPYGVELKNNIKKIWHKEMVQKNENIIGLDSAIFMNPKVWEASGHVKGFSDPLSECKNCHTRIRVDHLLEDAGIFADEKMTEKEINGLLEENKDKIKCPKCGKNDFTKAKSFNLLVKSNLGDFTDKNENPSYLRGETCQGIYVNFKNILDSTRQKIPFGVAQIGKAFRNEITARQFIFRTREFEQMEMQYFVKPDENEMKEYENWKEKRWNYYLKLGINPNNLKWHKHENLVFYAKEAYDIEYNFPFGFKELEGIHARSDYDLNCHSKASGVNLKYKDSDGEEYVPHIIETSTGVGRNILMILCEFYKEEELEKDTRIVMQFPYEVAPIKLAILPLFKKDGLSEISREIFENVKEKAMCEYDESGSIGKRYRRQDEIGTPYCITIDYQTKEDQTVTLRDRDTMEQKRIKIDEILSILNN
ncbi:glycine--tRNA ligase [Patescibacteria group bacterium]|nr:glycine--tRNA ligase [Patescibacteria group bacterium]